MRQRGLRLTLRLTPEKLEEKSEAETEREAEKEAMEYVRDIKGFYASLYCDHYDRPAGVTCFLFLAIPGALVPLGWGIGLLSHGLNVFELVNFFGPDWERRQIAKRMRRRQP